MRKMHRATKSADHFAPLFFSLIKDSDGCVLSGSSCTVVVLSDYSCLSSSAVQFPPKMMRDAEGGCGGGDERRGKEMDIPLKSRN
jgi:hypothetical protein